MQSRNQHFPSKSRAWCSCCWAGQAAAPPTRGWRRGWPKPRAGWLCGGRRSRILARVVHHSRAVSEGVVMGEQLLLEGKAAFFGISVTGSSLCREGRLEVHARAWVAARSLLTEAPISAVPALPAVTFSPSRYLRTKLDPGLEVSQEKAALQEPVSALHPSGRAGLPQEPRGIPAQPGHQPLGTRPCLPTCLHTRGDTAPGGRALN